uniref:Uncharacterized protein n=1 Tax=Arundo donax TaxID=35708 RepID=A0A0A8Z6M4_ARUDO
MCMLYNLELFILVLWLSTLCVFSWNHARQM